MPIGRLVRVAESLAHRTRARRCVAASIARVLTFLYALSAANVHELKQQQRTTQHSRKLRSHVRGIQVKPTTTAVFAAFTHVDKRRRLPPFVGAMMMRHAGRLVNLLCTQHSITWNVYGQYSVRVILLLKLCI